VQPSFIPTTPFVERKVDVDLQVLIFRHENFTMNRFTTWRSAMKTMRTEREPCGSKGLFR